MARARSARGIEALVAQVTDRLRADSSLLVQRLEGIDNRISRSQSASTDLAQGIFEALGDVRRATAVVADQAKEFASLQDLLRAACSRRPRRGDARGAAVAGAASAGLRDAAPFPGRVDR